MAESPTTRRTGACLTLALVLAGCTGEENPDRPARAAMDALIAFARTPSDAVWADVPLADSVGLGLGRELRVRRSARALRAPGAWKLSVDLFRGRAGTASALDLIAGEDGELTVTIGPHPHCASPPEPPPAEVAQLRRVVVQPREPDGCLDWWTVDAFVDDDGRIRAVTLDLWEP